MTITDLRTKRANLWNAMENFLDTRRNDKGILSAEDDSLFDICFIETSDQLDKPEFEIPEIIGVCG